MSEEQFQLVTAALRDHCGLRFGDESRALVEKRVTRRLRALGIESVAAYAELLGSAPSRPDEIDRLVEELTTNETYFFRELGPLRATLELLGHELAERRAAGAHAPLGIWSAGCSSGEEPYSVVMLGIEMGLQPGVDLRVYASDISRPVLAKARAGEYHEASFRNTDPRLRDRYFEARGPCWRISEDLRSQVVFSRVNLLDPQQTAVFGRMDLILCRNTMMYIDRGQRAQLIELFWEKLRPGGHLLLGHSESLWGLPTAFELRHLGPELVYQRPPNATRAEHAPPAPRPGDGCAQQGVG